MNSLCRLLCFVVVASASVFAASPATAQEVRPDGGVLLNVMMPLRDGVKLATDVYLPRAARGESPQKASTILIRTPYNKGTGKSAEGKYFSEHGYAVVIQDTRGRYSSEGTWHWMTDDGPDGVDCCAWIAKQPWSNGRIGMMGTSYVGGTQHAVAMAGSPHLKTVIPVDAVSNMGRQSMRNAGAFEMRFWNWIMLNAGKGSHAAQDPATAAVLTEMAAERHEYLKLQPPRPGTTPLKLAPEYESWLIEAMRHGANDSFWSQNNIVDFPEQYSEIPVYLVGGWYDSWAGNTTANYMALSGRLKSDVYLIMGPWIHGAQGSSSHGQVSFGKDAAISNPLAWRKVWFDHFLNGDDSGVGKVDPFQTKVRIFVMGTGDGTRDEKGRLNHGGSWRNENEWPLARAVATPFYFSPEGRLSTTKPGAGESATSFTFDPKDPVPTIGGNISSQNDIMLQGAWDQKGGPHVWNWLKLIPLSARNDILVFQTEPLAADTEVTGEIEVKLWISSTAVDTDFTAKLIDVYPPSADSPGGFDMNIGDGIVRARFRDSLKEERLMEPGTVYPVTVKLYPTSNVFKKGHRIRVDVSSSNFPRFDVNPNTGEPLAQNRRIETCVNTVYHDAGRPSQIVLPVIPGSR
ncbi:Cocaine esterase [Caulifigura coniformis]|uniref:Cocaine esterase n=1 Tax=Caulifigura coniformis TaxID=2527983 RepID=A0A517SJZ2_9PLAN|nr:CocE/NonD family hydrolase [Caulifigura coniformis]QDT56436.1 Cocaine esterase [Caulifigura coniformis]